MATNSMDATANILIYRNAASSDFNEPAHINTHATANTIARDGAVVIPNPVNTSGTLWLITPKKPIMVPKQ